MPEASDRRQLCARTALEYQRNAHACSRGPFGSRRARASAQPAGLSKPRPAVLTLATEHHDSRHQQSDRVQSGRLDAGKRVSRRFFALRHDPALHEHTPRPGVASLLRRRNLCVQQRSAGPARRRSLTSLGGPDFGPATMVLVGTCAKACVGSCAPGRPNHGIPFVLLSEHHRSTPALVSHRVRLTKGSAADSCADSITRPSTSSR